MTKASPNKGYKQAAEIFAEPNLKTPHNPTAGEPRAQPLLGASPPGHLQPLRRAGPGAGRAPAGLSPSLGLDRAGGSGGRHGQAEGPDPGVAGGARRSLRAAAPTGPAGSGPARGSPCARQAPARPFPSLRVAGTGSESESRAPPAPLPAGPAPSAPARPRPFTPSRWGGRVAGADRGRRRPRDAGREPALGSPSAAGRGPAPAATRTPTPPPPGHPPRSCFPSGTTGRGREGDGEEEEEKEAEKLSWPRRGYRESGVRVCREGKVKFILLKETQRFPTKF
ncbi:translation initiation factor IF-2-like [Pyrgilauda ruficollis]|uniref:translation initiation factor IF-2-like n=1 Tax=Pyrgilauda ruficollis TaxID=221976 RepID=UPI001B86A9A5|nr:translation initiation factor IF-2-like [Pyrgilauda ruficollis]